MRLSLSLVVLILGTALAQTTYTLGAGTEARFYIGEVLMGSDKTVVGTTQQVTGQLSLDLDNAHGVVIAPITIDARDLSTDDNRRNRQLQQRILNSAQDEFRYITFAPTAVSGLGEVLAVGDNLEALVTGDLTIRGVTQEVSFPIELTVASERELTGRGSASIRYADFGISIPRVPLVASVSDEVILELAFTATAD